MTKSPLHIPPVPVLWSPPPVTHVSNATPLKGNVVGPSPDNEIAFSAFSGDEAARACTGLVNKPHQVIQVHLKSCQDLAQHLQ